MGRHIGQLGVGHFLRPVTSKEPAGEDEDD